MRRAIASALITLFALTGCVTHDYLGEVHPPTEWVSVYYEHQPIPEGYRVMGQGSSTASAGMDSNAIVQEMIKKAGEVGADAVAIEGVSTYVTGTSTHINTHKHKHGKGRHKSVSFHTTESTSINRAKTIEATFLNRKVGEADDPD